VTFWRRAAGACLTTAAITACSTEPPAPGSAAGEPAAVAEEAAEDPAQTQEDLQPVEVNLLPGVETRLDTGQVVQATVGGYDIVFEVPADVDATVRGNDEAQALISMPRVGDADRHVGLTAVAGYFEYTIATDGNSYHHPRTLDLATFDPVEFLAFLSEAQPFLEITDVVTTDGITTFGYAIASDAPDDALHELEDGTKILPLVLGARESLAVWSVATDEIPHVGAFVPLEDAWYVITSAEDEQVDGTSDVQTIVDTLQLADGFDTATVSFAAPADIGLPQARGTWLTAGATFAVDLHPQPVSFKAPADGQLDWDDVSTFRESGQNEDIPTVWLRHADTGAWMRLATLESRIESSADWWEVRRIDMRLDTALLPRTVEAFTLGARSKLDVEGAIYGFKIEVTANPSSVFSAHGSDSAMFTTTSKPGEDWHQYLTHDRGKTLLYYLIRFDDVDYALVAEPQDEDAADEIAATLQPYAGSFEEGVDAEAEES
jgi:hypothetical protein